MPPNPAKSRLIP